MTDEELPPLSDLAASLLAEEGKRPPVDAAIADGLLARVVASIGDGGGGGDGGASGGGGSHGGPVVESRGASAGKAAGGTFSASVLAVSVGGALAVGLVNGLLVTWRRVPPFVATFAMLIVVNGARLAYSRGQSAGSAPAWVSELGSGAIAGLPIPVAIWLVLFLILAVALRWTTWGRWLYAAGTNREAARHAGVPVSLVVTSTYFVTAAAAALAGILLSGHVGYVDNTLGINHNLNSMAAAIIGGVAFSGGRGGVFGSAMGALLLTIMVNLLVVMGFDLFWQQIVQGAVLVIAVLIQGLRQRRTERT